MTNENDNVSWWAADVAADDSGCTVLLGGDIRPTIVHNSPLTIYHLPFSHQVDYVVLGIDPGTATTGYGVVARTMRGDFALLACGVIRTSPDELMHLRLLELFNDVQGLIREFRPNAMAVEKLFFGRNVTNALSVGQARGAILLAAALDGLSLAEYTPAEVKQSISGYGNADKRQMQEMVQRLLDLESIPKPDDAADGVAIAICHLQAYAYRKLVGDS